MKTREARRTSGQLFSSDSGCMFQNEPMPSSGSKASSMLPFLKGYRSIYGLHFLVQARTNQTDSVEYASVFPKNMDMEQRAMFQKSWKCDNFWIFSDPELMMLAVNMLWKALRAFTSLWSQKVSLKELPKIASKSAAIPPFPIIGSNDLFIWFIIPCLPRKQLQNVHFIPQQFIPDLEDQPNLLCKYVYTVYVVVWMDGCSWPTFKGQFAVNLVFEQNEEETEKKNHLPFSIALWLLSLSVKIMHLKK